MPNMPTQHLVAIHDGIALTVLANGRKIFDQQAGSDETVNAFLDQLDFPLEADIDITEHNGIRRWEYPRMPASTKTYSDVEKAVVAWLRARPYGQTAAAIYQDSTIWKSYRLDDVKGALLALGRRRMVVKKGCSRTVLFQLTPRGEGK